MVVFSTLLKYLIRSRQYTRLVWEYSQKDLIEMAADRGAYIDQSQSFNVHMANCTSGKLTSMHFCAWKAGLKTGMYYLRTKAAADAIKFTVDNEKLEVAAKKQMNAMKQQAQNKENTECINCGA